MQAVEMKGMLLPPKEGHCRICAVKHEPDMPHDATSLFYGVRFKMRYGREGTWADAVAHLPPERQALVRKAFEITTERVNGEHGTAYVWTEPPEGVEPISEPIDG